jgi:hypothetical protein
MWMNAIMRSGHIANMMNDANARRRRRARAGGLLRGRGPAGPQGHHRPPRPGGARARAAAAPSTPRHRTTARLPQRVHSSARKACLSAVAQRPGRDPRSRRGPPSVPRRGPRRVPPSPWRRPPRDPPPRPRRDPPSALSAALERGHAETRPSPRRRRRWDHAQRGSGALSAARAPSLPCLSTIMAAVSPCSAPAPRRQSGRDSLPPRRRRWAW